MKKMIISITLGLVILLLSGCRSEIDLESAADQIEIQQIVSADTQMIYLPHIMNGANISWSSSHPHVLEIDGTVHLPSQDTLVFMTATLSHKKNQFQKTFTITVKANLSFSMAEYVNWVDTIVFYRNIIDDILLPITHPAYGGDIIWTSSDETILSSSGVVDRDSEDRLVTLTANISYLGQEESVVFEVTVIRDEELSYTTKRLIVLQDIQGVIDKNNTTITQSLTLPTSASLNASISWRSSHPDILGLGVFNRVDTDVSVTLYFTITIGEVIYPEESIQIIVKKAEQDPADIELSAYYKEAEGLSGAQLVAALRTIVSRNHQLHSYATVWTILMQSDEDPNNKNNVILFYTNRSQAKNTNGGNRDQWNREHVWPQSRGGFTTSVGPGTDVHHIKPADVIVNAARGNNDFAMGGTFVNDYQGVPTLNRKTANTFEPYDGIKGDAARMILYMYIRYNLPVVETTLGSGINLGKLSTMLDWNNQDVPDTFETRRNEIIYGYQNNRNPFIDYPHLADLIWQRATDMSHQVFSAQAKLLDAPVFSLSDWNIKSTIEIQRDYISTEIRADILLFERTKRETFLSF